VFPIVLQVASGNPPNAQFTVQNCELNDLAGPGYCTAIAIWGDGIAHQGGANFCGTVINNKVFNCNNGGAFGIGGYVDNVTFAHNYAMDCKLGFNADTARSLNVSIHDNQFVRCGQGINLGGSGLE